MKFILSAVVGFCLISGQSHANTLAVSDVESYWAVECDKTRGLLSYDRSNLLRRNTGLDALGVRVYKKEINPTTSSVKISGILYGRVCEKIQLQDKVVYHWKNISIAQNNRIRPHLSSVKGFMSSENFELKIERDWYFELNTTTEKFLGSKKAAKVAQGKGLHDQEFHVVFKIKYHEIENIPALSRGANPFVIFKYNLEAQNDGSVRFTN